jgi:hypothetical protein
MEGAGRPIDAGSLVQKQRDQVKGRGIMLPFACPYYFGPIFD